MGMKKKIIKAARKHCKTDFMQYPDYDEDIKMSLYDAITVLISEHLPDEGMEVIYDFLEKKIKPKPEPKDFRNGF